MIDLKEIGNVFNEYFVNVGFNLVVKILIDEYIYKFYLK